MTKKETLLWYAYVYDEYYGCILCLQNKVLSYATTNHEGYQKSKSYVCQSPCAGKLHAKPSVREDRYTSYLAGLNGDLYYFSISIARSHIALPQCGFFDRLGGFLPETAPLPLVGTPAPGPCRERALFLLHARIS